MDLSSKIRIATSLIVAFQVLTGGYALLDVFLSCVPLDPRYFGVAGQALEGEVVKDPP